MKRLGSKALVAALALAVAGAPVAAYAAPAPAPAAYRPAPGARTVTGGDSTADGPELATGRTYEDVLEAGRDRYYRLELDARSSVYVAATVRPARAAAVTYADGVEVVLMSAGGKECPGAESARFGNDQARPLTGVAVRRLQEDAPCQEPGTYYVKVSRTGAEDADRSDWPMELHVMREPALSGGNAPGAAPSGWPSAPVVPPGGQAVPRSGGTGFNDARALDAGVWRDDIQPGQTLYYRVPVDWARQLSVAAELAGARMTKDYGFASYGLVTQVYSPVRAPAGAEDGTYSGKQLEVALGPLAPVSYDNRWSSDAKTRQLSAAGWYYVAVTLNRKVAEFTTGSVPLTLRITLDGTARPGPPYAEPGAARAGFGIVAADRDAAEAGQTASEAAAAEARRGTMRRVAAGGIGTGTVLVLGLGVWTLLSRRRAAAGR
ncbi:hypothetical protein [Streptomyces sp. NPDC093225]|uniref:hypothetical protein n=1 Tax=Streptomyces sp. NPDC093225 TaxID=3366034 RepID=UPI003830E97A